MIRYVFGQMIQALNDRVPEMSGSLINVPVGEIELGVFLPIMIALVSMCIGMMFVVVICGYFYVVMARKTYYFLREMFIKFNVISRIKIYFRKRLVR